MSSTRTVRFSLLAFACAILVASLCWPALAAPLKWEQRQGYRVAELSVPPNGHAGFTLLTPEQTGIFFTNQLSYQRSLKNQNLLNGAGVAAGDFDGDGLPDLYFCNEEGASALFRNLGNWKFEDVTARSDVACTNQASRSAVFADLNGDGRPDLLVGSISGPNACFLNLGNGRFSNITESAGLVLKAGCHTMALADIDGNGTLDLYIANYGENSILRGGGLLSVRTVNGKPVVTGRYANRIKIIDGMMVEYGEPDALYLNDGQGHFTRVSWTDGSFLDTAGQPLKVAPNDMGLSVMFRDLNGDGAPDIYVCNDFQTPDRIWLNDGHGRFRALPDTAIRTSSQFSMGVDFADIDRDGFDDIFVTDMLSRFHSLQMTQISPTNPPLSHVGEPTDRRQSRHNTLLLNRGDVTYAEIANFAGVAASDWSWSAVFLDVDLDGYEDLLIATGHAHDTQDLDTAERSPKENSAGFKTMPMQSDRQLSEYPPLSVPNVAFRNRGNRTFEERGAAWGFDSTNVSHGIALADLDNDGDLDVIVSCLWKPPLIYRNESSAPRLAVRLRGKAPNTQGIGAKIKVYGGAVPVQSQEMISGGRYLSGDDPMRVFAAGSLQNKLSIEVTWRNGARSIVRDALPNHIYEIEESGSGNVPPLQPAPATAGPPLFEDASNLISRPHEEDAFEELERQPLLPKLLGQLGPGAAWLDLSGDGHDDLVIGSSKGQIPVILKAGGKGKFSLLEPTAPFKTLPDDMTGMAAWVSSPGKRMLLLGVASYESGDSAGALLQFDPAAKTLTSVLPGSSFAGASCGPIAVADIDGDGALDVFVGGRVIPGHYPEPAPSRLFLNRGGQLKTDEKNSPLFKTAGLVSGAVFSDLNGDGFPDLILACEWGPVRIYLNDKGTFREATAELGLANYLGWWNGVTTADLDGDGKLDIIASNWGLNSSYGRPTPEKPLWIYATDIDNNGTLDLLEMYTEADTGRIIPRRNLLTMAAAIPNLRERFPTHASWAKADVDVVLGDAKSKTFQLRATTLASTVFFNRGDHFEAQPLPDEAQFAPAFGISVADFNGDGFEDIFLAQNCFAVPAIEPRLDSGRGLLLAGAAGGKFTPVSAQGSGIEIYGEQRGCAVGDFDEDGRPDLLVTSKNSQTRLLRNARGQPGLRVKLKGPPGNPDGIGAVLRLQFSNRLGPAREIHAGSGYWSQDSLMSVLALPGQAKLLEIRWPGGRTTSHPVPVGAHEMVAEFK